MNRIGEAVRAALQKGNQGGSTHMGIAIKPGQQHVLSALGMEDISWNPRNEAEVKKAKEVFETLMGPGKASAAYKMTSKSEGEVIRQFDPEAEHIIVARQTAGG